MNEKEVFWKQVRWVDYSGRVTPTDVNGIALFDHPSNPRFPTRFHVRNDGWMGASFCKDGPYELAPGDALTLRYRLYAHGPNATPESITQHWKVWAE